MRKFQSSFIKGQNLIIVMIKAFKLWLLSGGGSGLLSMRLQQVVLLNSIKGKSEDLGHRGLS